MRVIVEGDRIELQKTSLIASGGEGMIFQDPLHPRSRALKIYHNPTKERGDKLVTFLNSNFEMPPSVIAPINLVTDEKGNRVVKTGVSW